MAYLTENENKLLEYKTSPYTICFIFASQRYERSWIVDKIDRLKSYEISMFYKLIISYFYDFAK
jgi:hypothetical protein